MNYLEPIVSSTNGSEESLLVLVIGVKDQELLGLFFQIMLFLALDDVDAILAEMATAVSVADTEGEPLWLLLVGASSGSKSETIRMVAKVADRQQSDVTLAGLLSQRPGRPATGMLAKLGDNCNAFVTISDMSSLLSRTGSGGGKSGQQQTGILEALRDIYDGMYSRLMDQVNPQWQGRITLLGAVTPAIDQMRAHADALGPRWVYFRLHQLDRDQRKAVSQLVARRENLQENRTAVAELVAELVHAARARLPSVVVDDDTMELVQDCADLATYGRATVPRDYRGQVDGVAHWEEPARLTHQLMKLCRSLIALNVDDAAVRRVVRRAALSCMPSDRLNALQQLAGPDEWLSTNAVAQRAKQHRAVTKRALEDWETTGVVELRIREHNIPVDEELEGTRYDSRTREWGLSADHRDQVLALLSEGG